MYCYVISRKEGIPMALGSREEGGIGELTSSNMDSQLSISNAIK